MAQVWLSELQLLEFCKSEEKGEGSLAKGGPDSVCLVLTLGLRLPERGGALVVPSEGPSETVRFP